MTPSETPPGEGVPMDTGGHEALEGLIGAGGVATFSGRQMARARELLTRVYALRRAVRFYPLQHPATSEAVDDLFAVIKQYHGEGVDVPLTFFEGELLLGEQLLPEDSIMFDQLIRDMTTIGAGSVTFVNGLTREELERAVPVLTADPAGIEQMGGIETAARAADTPHVVIGTVKVIDKESGPAEGEGESLELAQDSYGGALELMRELERVIRTNQVVSIGMVKGVVRSLVDNVLGNRFAMLELSGLKSYDEYTFYHSVNVAILSLALGSLITQESRFLSSLGVGALLHDIGKMAIDVEILNKPGTLTMDEWAQMREHPVYGAQMASGIRGLDKSAVVMILEHHLRYDLGGYPKRSSSRPQHLASRVVAVSDAYDAMTSRRSYSAARLQDQAMLLLARNAGTALDPALVRLFVELMGVYPPRSVVRLSGGEIAVVLGEEAADIAHPRVRVISDSGGTMIDPYDLDLGDPEARKTIVRCLDPAGLNVDVEDYM